MTLNEFNAWANGFLKKENFPSDPSRNGIQIQNSDPCGKQIKKVAFAVDACLETVELAAKNGADVLFVHHGLFWGGCDPLVGNHYERLAAFIKNDIALVAYHLPLDANNPYGNNWGMAARLDCESAQSFGTWRGMELGVKVSLKNEMTVSQVAEKLLRPGVSPVAVLEFGKKKVKTVGIISGGAADDVEQAVGEELDLFVTGEMEHELFHYCKENHINIIAGGHYETETVGVNLVMEKVKRELGLETVFIDVPTGL